MECILFLHIPAMRSHDSGPCEANSKQLNGFLKWCVSLAGLGWVFAHRFALEFDFIGVVDDSIHDRIG